MRLFVAVRPPAAALDDLERALAPVRGLAGGPRWTDPAWWHLTLAFLGEVGEDRLDRLGTALGQAAGDRRPLTLRLAGAGTFPARGAPSVLWVGVSEETERPADGPADGDRASGRRADSGGTSGDRAGNDRAGKDHGGSGLARSDRAGSGPTGGLARLARATARAARGAGVPVERRPYHPHLTLGRWRPSDRADRSVAARWANYAGPPFGVTLTC